ncbi:hypothetical protein MTP99_009822 [Tenebrio molitor]|jgi:hypothetical protein|nr:hypothetical protein MTP99_009822 [Tenebrio molitor]
MSTLINILCRKWSTRKGKPSPSTSIITFAPRLVESSLLKLSLLSGEVIRDDLTAILHPPERSCLHYKCVKSHPDTINRAPPRTLPHKTSFKFEKDRDYPAREHC